MGGGGEAAGRHCNDSNFISMLSCLLLFCFFCYSLSLFVGSFSFSSPFKGTSLIWMEYRITLLVCLCLHLFVQRRSIVRSSLSR